MYEQKVYSECLLSDPPLVQAFIICIGNTEVSTLYINKMGMKQKEDTNKMIKYQLARFCMNS